MQRNIENENLGKLGDNQNVIQALGRRESMTPLSLYTSSDGVEKGLLKTQDMIKVLGPEPSSSNMVLPQIEMRTDVCPVPLLYSLRIQAIRAQQRSEGNFDCFGRAITGYCDQFECAHHYVCINLSPQIRCD